MKQKVSFVCQECGYDSPAYLGKCPECGMWNTLKEFKTQNLKLKTEGGMRPLISTPKKLSEIAYTQNQRISTGFSEMDTVLGGGVVSGSVMLLAGDPGVGKSTLLLQVALLISKGAFARKVLYVSGEESEEQIKLRAERILQSNKKSDGSKIDQFSLISASDTDGIVQMVESEKPQLLIIDSIQTMESQLAGGLSGAVGQVRYAAAQFIRLAKQSNIPTIIVGHVTKEGMVAGPMILSHMVDVVLFFEGEKATTTRILRSFKNRFGPVDEVGIFSMTEGGISQVSNPEHIFLSDEGRQVAGSVLSTTLEGTRPFLVELQGLVVPTQLPIPRRVASGVDSKRLELLLAVLQKHAKLSFFNMDVFVNAAGGLKISDRATDLAVCLALFSSLKNVNLSKTVAIAEVGLLGELRSVPGIEKRMKEAKKLGFSDIITAKTHKTLFEVIKSLK